MAINIIIADDHPYFRKGISSELKNHEEISIRYEAQNGLEVIEWLSENQADILLLDLFMPKMSGYEVMEELRRRQHSILVIVMSMQKVDEIIDEIVAKGAKGYICKDDDSLPAYAAIKDVYYGGTYYTDHANKALLKKMLNNSKNIRQNELHFDTREIQIIKMLSEEYSNQEISERLYLGVRTIEGIRQSLMKKTGAKNIIGVVMYAQKHGLLK